MLTTNKMQTPNEKKNYTVILISQSLTRNYINNIGIKHVFPCINIRWVPREMLKTEGAARGFQHRTRNSANVNARKNMFDRYYCIKVSTKIDFRAVFRCIILALFCFDFFTSAHEHNFHFVLVSSVNNYSIMAENWQ